MVGRDCGVALKILSALNITDKLCDNSLIVCSVLSCLSF